MCRVQAHFVAFLVVELVALRRLCGANHSGRAAAATTRTRPAAAHVRLAFRIAPSVIVCFSSCGSSSCFDAGLTDRCSQLGGGGSSSSSISSSFPCRFCGVDVHRLLDLRAGIQCNTGCSSDKVKAKRVLTYFQHDALRSTGYDESALRKRVNAAQAAGTQLRESTCNTSPVSSRCPLRFDSSTCTMSFSAVFTRCCTGVAFTSYCSGNARCSVSC
jgi:hypothetical protein